MTAPLVVDGEIFRRYVEQHLAPTPKPGELVMMDNLNEHRVAGVKEAIEAAQSQLLFLPPYRPDFNPIDQVFSKVKRLLRTSGERTVEALRRRCGELLDHFQETESRNYFRNCGYRHSR